MKKIAVIGAGSWGSALAKVLAENKYTTTLYMRSENQLQEFQQERKNTAYLPGILFPEELSYTASLEEAVKGAEVLVLAVPSQQARSVMLQVREFISARAVLVNVSKGIERSTQKRISQVASELLPHHAFVALSGPSHAEEVAQKMPTTLVAASEDQEAAQQIQDLFSNDYMRIYTSNDVIGVELGGTLKNIIAFGAGIVDGLGYGDNTKAALMTRGIVEMVRFGTSLGAHGNTFTGLSGIGDLIVTCTSRHSRNRRAGYLMGRGYSKEETLAEVRMVVEGIVATEVIFRMAQELGIEMPITQEIYALLSGEKSVEDSVKNLMGRERKHEIERILSIEDLETGEEQRRMHSKYDEKSCKIHEKEYNGYHMEKNES